MPETKGQKSVPPQLCRSFDDVGIIRPFTVTACTTLLEMTTSIWSNCGRASAKCRMRICGKWRSGSGTIRQGFSSVQPQIRHVPAFGSNRFGVEPRFFATLSAFKIPPPPFRPRPRATEQQRPRAGICRGTQKRAAFPKRSNCSSVILRRRARSCWTSLLAFSAQNLGLSRRSPKPPRGSLLFP